MVISSLQVCSLARRILCLELFKLCTYIFSVSGGSAMDSSCLERAFTSRSKLVHGRKKVVLDALGPYLHRLNLEAFNVTEYVNRIKDSNYSHVPTIGMAISGGGWASPLTGTGALRAFDSRLPAAVEQGTGGLLQSMTYFSGLSGGAWPVMSLSTNNFPTIDDVVASWHVDIDRLFGVTNDTNYAATTETLLKDVAAKAAAGFNVSAADFLGRGWSYEFVPGAGGGLKTTMSATMELSNFVNYSMPLPLLQAI
jgi:lysophospholipase